MPTFGVQNAALRKIGRGRRIVGLIGGAVLALSVVTEPAMAHADPGKPTPPPYAAPSSGNKPQGGGAPAPKPLLLKDKRPALPAKPGNSPDIIGGTVATPGEFPYFVSVQTFFGSHFCGGSLLSTTNVLTAAHCVDEATPPDLRVSVGGTTLVPDNGVIRFVSAITVHPSWDPVSFENDVAILTLAQPILRSDPAEWLRLARGNELGLIDHLNPAVVMGHGCCAPPDPNNLIKVTVPIQNDTVMASIYHSDFYPQTMMGAGSRAGGQDTCSGDSGGPLVVAATPRPVQIGDVSWGNGCALPNFPGVYGELYQGPLAAFVNSLVARPSHDDFGRCQTLGGNAGSAPGSTENATAEPGEFGGGEASVWYCWTPTVSGPAQIAVNQHGYDSVLDVWTGSSVSGLSLVAFNDDANGTLQSEVEFAAVAGRTYRIRVDGFLFDYGEFRLSYGVNRPANDDFAAAQVLDGPIIARITATNDTATGEAGEPAPLTVIGAADATVWYSWTPPETGLARCSTHGSNYDTSLAAYTGTSLPGLTMVADNDDTNATFQSLISFSATAGTAYRIQVGGFVGRRGAISLQCTVNPPGNDLSAAGLAIGDDLGTEFGSTARAIGEPGEPAFLVPPDGSVWYQWTAPYSGNFLFDTCGSDFDTVLAAATGTFIRDLALIAANDDTTSICPGLQSVISFVAEAGTVYQISVNGFSSSARGEFELHWVPI
jgi:hypothetical protein